MEAPGNEAPGNVEAGAAPGVDEPVDVVVIGAGAAGLATAWHLAGHGRSVVLVEPPGPPGSSGSASTTGRPASRTWCWWTSPADPFATVATARWSMADVIGPDHDRQRLDLAPLQYVMLRSPDLESLVGQRLARAPGAARVAVRVHEVQDGPRSAVVRGHAADGSAVEIHGRWVVDTRPVTPRGGRTHLLQHFRGWFVRYDRPVFDPTVPILMDFRTPQPPRGVSFGYVLPTSDREALVEYTEFSRNRLADQGYHDALQGYLGILDLPDPQVLDVEDGAIPMTDAVFDRRVGQRVVRAGTAGGATRPSTGYTFSGAQRQARAIAAAVVAGRVPVPPVPYPRRHRMMDAVLLDALDSGRLDSAQYLAGLFRRHPTGRVLRFLDGGTWPWEDLLVMAGSPWRPMLRSVFAVARDRCR
ncbi:MAG: FAD-dependent oxidoreductase [Angustibacter sp.]